MHVPFILKHDVQLDMKQQYLMYTENKFAEKHFKINAGISIRTLTDEITKITPSRSCWF
jgi:hypothetical protein